MTTPRPPGAAATPPGGTGPCLGRPGAAARRRSLQKMLDAVLLAGEFGERLVDALLAERIDRQALDDLVLAAFAGDRVAEHHVLRDAVLAVARHAHRDPLAVRAERPV